MSKLDNNSKMIISKYLCGNNFTNIVSLTHNLNTYYHTTFNYITINRKITKQLVEKIVKTLKQFPNLNEIVLNIVSTYALYYLQPDFLEFVESCYNKFKPYYKNIKFNILDSNYKMYHLNIIISLKMYLNQTLNKRFI